MDAKMNPEAEPFEKIFKSKLDKEGSFSKPMSPDRVVDLLADEVIREPKLLRDCLRWGYIAGQERGRLDIRAERGREVLQLTLEGDIVKRWATGIVAARALGISHSSIYRSCRKGQIKAGGYLWCYADEKEC